MVFMRRYETLVHFDAEGQSTFIAQHYAILHAQALQAGNVSIAWNPASGDPVIHRLLVHRDGERIDVLKNSEFEILRREGQLEQAILDGMLTAVLRVPDLRVGDELELAYTVPSHDATLGDTNFGMLYLGDNPPPGRVRLGLDWIEGQKPHYTIPQGLEPFAKESSNSVDFLADNVPLATMPNDAPLRYAWHRMAQYTDFNDWPQVSRRFDGLFDKAAQLSADSAVKREARRIASAHSGQKERAEAALDLVQQQVRYIYVGLNGGNYTPASAETTWERRYGDCKGKTALLLALLGELGIEARAVLVNNQNADDGLNERLPSPGEFDHVVVQADIGGKTYWLDGTMPNVVEMRTDPFLAYRWVLPLSATGSELKRVAQRPFDLPQEMGLFEIDARKGFDEPAAKTYVTVKRGLAGVLEYVQFSALTPAQIDSAFKSNMDGSEWDAIDSVTYRYDRMTQASIVTIKGVGPVDWDDEGAGAFGLSLPGGGFSPPPRRRRPVEQDQSAPYYTPPAYSCHATTVRLPDGTKLENWGFNTTYTTQIYGRVYHRMMERRDDRTIRMVRASRVEQPEISAALAASGNSRLDEFDNSKANISYDPDQKMTPWGDLKPVPAVYEIDWTGTEAQCLPNYLM